MKKIASSREQLILWFSAKNRLITREMLSHLNLIPPESFVCAQCGHYGETAEDAFSLVRYVSKFGETDYMGEGYHLFYTKFAA